jgi:hypothetical protein
MSTAKILAFAGSARQIVYSFQARPNLGIPFYLQNSIDI